MPDVLSNLYPRHHSETKAVKHWNCYWREVLTQMFNTEVIRAHPYIWLWKGKTKRQYRSWHSAPSVTSIYRFVGFFEDTSSPENTNSWCFLDCLTISANIAHIIKTHFVVKSKTTLPFVYFKRTWKVYVLPLESLKTQLFWLWHWTFATILDVFIPPFSSSNTLLPKLPVDKTKSKDTTWLLTLRLTIFRTRQVIPLSMMPSLQNTTAWWICC